MSAHDWRRATAAPFGGRNFVAYQGSPGRTRLPVHHAPHAPHSADASRASYGPDASLNGTAPLPRLQRSLDGSLEVENSRLRGAVDELQSALELQRTGYEQRVRDAMDVGNQSSAAVAAAQDAADASAQEVSSAHHAALQLRRQVAVLEAELQAERQRHRDAVATDREQQARAAVAAQTEAGRLSQEIVGLSEENARLRAVVAEQRGDLAKAADNAAAQSTALQDLTREVTRLDPYQLVKQHRQSEAAQQLQGELIEKIEAGARDVAMARAERDSAREELQRLHAVLEDQGREARDQRIALREAHDAEQRSWRQDTDALRSQLRAAEQRASGAEAAAAAGKDSDAELRFVLQTSRGKAERAAQQVQQLADSLEALRVEHQALLDRCGDLEAEARGARAKLADATAATKRAEARAKQADAKAAAAVDAQVSADAAAAAERERAQVLSRRGEALQEELGRADAAAAAEPTLSGIGRRLSHEEEEEVERRVEERTEEAEAQAAEAQLRAEGEKAARLAAEAAAVAAPQQAVPVRLRVVRCAGLLDRDGGKIASGASDPYVRVVDPFGAEVLRTAVVDNTVDPVFPPDSSTAAVTVAPDTEGSVVLEVWDWNPLGDSYLGGHAVSVADLFEYGPCTRELRLQPREQEPDDLIFDSVGHLGALHLEVAGVPAVETSPVRARPEPDAVQHDVTLRVVKCAGLMDRDGGLSGRSDPYVTVTGARGDVVLTTPVVDNTLHPAFERDAATAALRLSKATPGAVRVDVWDHNTVGRDKYLGGATVSVEDLFAFGPATRTLPLRPRPKESDPEVFARAGELGTVTVEVGGVPPSAAPPRPVPRTRTGGETTVVAHTVPVTIAVAACHDLLNRDGGGAFGDSDPFVVVRDPRGTEVLRTPTIDNCNNPTWDSARATLRLAKATPGALRVDVWNWNHVRNDYLGGCDLPVAELFERGNGPWPLRLRPRPKESDRFVVDNAHRLGSVEVTVAGLGGQAETVVGAEASAAAVAMAQQRPTVTVPTAAASHVVLKPVRCSRLLDRDGGGLSGLSDPYVVVLDPFGNVAARTPHVPDSLNPDFGPDAPAAELPLVSSAPGRVTVQVWDHNAVTADRFLGCVAVPVADLFAFGPCTREWRLAPRPGEQEPEVQANAHRLGTVTVAVSGVPPPQPPLPDAPEYEASSDRPSGAVSATKAAADHDAATKGAAAAGPPVPAADQVPPEPVTFHVEGCSGLLDRDGGGLSGSSDPFVTVTDACGTVAYTSPVIGDTTEPSWPQPTGDDARCVVHLSPAMGGALTLAVWNWNRLVANDFLGEVRLTPKEIYALGAGTHERQLRPREEEPDSLIFGAAGRLGTMTLRISGIPAKHAPAPAAPASGKPGVPKIPRPVAATVEAAQDATQYGVGVYVAACHDLLNRDGGGAFGDSDPFVVVRDPRGTEVLRTPTIDNSSDPTWSRSEAGATVQLSKATPGALRVDVWNWNHVRNDYLGGCDLPVAELFERGNGPWPLRLRPRPKESDRFVVDNAHRLGSATVFISHVPVLQEAPTPSAPPSAPPAVSSPLRNGTSVSFVGEADDEPSGGDAAPGAGTQRPSIASSVDDGQLGSDPFAPQPLSTSMRATGAPVDLRRRRVSSSLVGFGDDDEQFVDPADLAAAAESLRLQRPPPGEEDEGQGDGGTGEARPAVESTASLDPSIAEQSPTPPAAAPAAVGPTSVQATVSVVGCTGLMDRDGGFSGVSDPFVKLLSAAGEVMHTSSVIDNELNPTWAPPDASADLVVVRPAAAAEAWLDAPAAVIEVWDHNTVASNTFLGRAEVSNGEVLALATAGATNEFSMPLLQRRDEMDGDVVAAARSGLGLGSIKVGLTARSAADADGNAL